MIGPLRHNQVREKQRGRQRCNSPMKREDAPKTFSLCRVLNTKFVDAQCRLKAHTKQEWREPRADRVASLLQISLVVAINQIRFHTVTLFVVSTRKCDDQQSNVAIAKPD